MLTARSERITRARRRVAGAVQRRLPRITRRVVGASVLLYHRVASSPADPWQLAVTPDHFDEHLQVLRANGDVVDAAPTAQRFRRHSLGRRRFAVTFDDGYVDNLQAALPLLERHDVPVTIFVATAYLDQPSFWWDRFDVLVLGDATSVEAGAEAAVAAGLLDTQRFGEVV
ncbi:MAG: polysaccharide deacetylase family protein, partial [Ilumatobacteraceae bacterium]